MIRSGDQVIFNADGKHNGARWGLNPGDIVTVFDIRRSEYTKGLVFDVKNSAGEKMHGFGPEWISEIVGEDF